jgi:hypothetical protein
VSEIADIIKTQHLSGLGVELQDRPLNLNAE